MLILFILLFTYYILYNIYIYLTLFILVILFILCFWILFIIFSWYSLLYFLFILFIIDIFHYIFMIFFTFKIFILYTYHLYLARHLLYIPFGYLTWLWYRWPIEIDGLPIKHDDFPWLCGYGSIPINTIFRGMNIHLPAILMFTRGTRLWHTAIYKMHTHRHSSSPVGSIGSPQRCATGHVAERCAASAGGAGQTGHLRPRHFFMDSPWDVFFFFSL